MYRLMVKRRRDTKRFAEDQRFQTNDADHMEARRRWLIASNFQVRTEAESFTGTWYELRTDTNAKRMHM